MTKLSLCIIAKNEEGGLKRAVDSAKPFIDEVVIGVDGSSSDNTLSIAKELGDVVYEYEWPDDFSSAWNQAIEKCSGDWVLILSGHEYVHSFGEIDFDKIDEDAIRVRVEMEGESSIIYERIIRNTVRFKNKIHMVSNSKSFVVMDNIVIKHDRSIQSKEARRLRALQRDDMISRHLSGRGDSRSLFYLGQQHRDAGRWSDAIKTFNKYLKVATWDDEIARAREYLSEAYSALGSDLGYHVLTCDRKEHDYLKAKYMYGKKNYRDAVVHCLDALNREDRDYAFSSSNIEMRCYDLLSMCFYHLKQNDLAKTAALISLSYGDNERVRKNIEYFSRGVKAGGD